MATQSHRSNGLRAPRRRDRQNPVHHVDCLGRSQSRRSHLVSGARATMTVGGGIGAKAAGRKAIFLLLALLGLSAGVTYAQSINCVGDAGGIVDGFVNYPVPPSQINIDGPCTIRNYTAANPLTSNISWFGSLPGSTLLILDNVVMTGNMSCNLAVQGNRIWLVNGTSTTL